MAGETWERLRIQAGLQAARRAGGDPEFVLREQVDGRGFDLLPEPDEGDLFYDIEGDPYYPDGGLEYLHGIWMLKDGDWDFVDFWAHDRTEEAKLTHDLLDFLSTPITVSVSKSSTVPCRSLRAGSYGQEGSSGARSRCEARTAG